MPKGLLVRTLILMLSISLIALIVLSGCGSENIEEENINISENVDIADDTDDDPEETGSVEDLPEEDKSTEAQIISISVEEVLKIIENDEDYIIVDVRTKDEYGGGHLEGALLIPVQELEGRLDELAKDDALIVYCRSGGRSRNASEILVSNGFQRVYDMGGINTWNDKGYPIILEK